MPSTNSVTAKAHSVIDEENNLEYWVVPITEKISAGTNKIFTLLSLYNTPFYGSRAWIWGTFYSNKEKILDGAFPLSNAATNGGI